MQWKSNAKFNQPAEEGSIFSLKTEAPCARVVIHKIHGCGNSWYLSCPLLDIDDKPLNTEDFNTAVEHAKVVVRTNLNLLLDTYAPFATDTSENEIVRY